MAFKMKSPFKSVNAQGWSGYGTPVNTPIGVPNQPMPQQPAGMGQPATAYNTGQMQRDLFMGKPSLQTTAPKPPKPKPPRKPRKTVNNTSNLAAEVAQAQSFQPTYTPTSYHGSLMDFRGGGSALVKRRRRRNNRMRRQ